MVKDLAFFRDEKRFILHYITISYHSIIYTAQTKEKYGFHQNVVKIMPTLPSFAIDAVAVYQNNKLQRLAI